MQREKRSRTNSKLNDLLLSAKRHLLLTIRSLMSEQMK